MTTVRLHVFLSVVSGTLLVSADLYHRAHLTSHLDCFLCQSGYDVTALGLRLLSTMGALTTAVACLRWLRHHVMLKYLIGIFGQLICVVVIGTLLSQLRHQIHNVLRLNMETIFRETVVSYDIFDVEPWNYLQTEKSCCGVHGYKDYLRHNQTRNIVNSFPTSCCVRKPSAQGYIDMVNYTQCLSDASRGLQQSAFLHVQGCHVILADVITSHLHHVLLFLYASALSQMAALLNIGWTLHLRRLKTSPRHC